jgi:hypothetical protein
MPLIIPIVIPLSAVSSMAGEYVVLRFMNANRMNSMF